MRRDGVRSDSCGLLTSFRRHFGDAVNYRFYEILLIAVVGFVAIVVVLWRDLK